MSADVGYNILPNITKFEDLKITTTTQKYTLNGTVNVALIFYLLPVTKMILPPGRSVSKCKLPHCSTPGAIISIKSFTEVRGIVKSSKGGLKNSILIDLSASTKNVNIKLSLESMEICGIPSVELGTESINLLINHINNIQNVITSIKENKDVALRTIQWIKDNVKGDKIDRYECTQRGKFKIYNKIDDYSIVYPINTLPYDLNFDLAKYIISICSDFVYYNDMCIQVDSLINLPDIINNEDKKLAITSFNFWMVNYNYYLDFVVDLEALHRVMNDSDEFYTHYHNSFTHCVTIELPYDPSLKAPVKNKKNDIPKITFLCYRTGNVTQSGPGGHIMEESYYKFRSKIESIRSQIEFIP